MIWYERRFTRAVCTRERTAAVAAAFVMSTGRLSCPPTQQSVVVQEEDTLIGSHNQKIHRRPALPRAPKFCLAILFLLSVKRRFAML
jgi:hypothetical protein